MSANTKNQKMGSFMRFKFRLVNVLAVAAALSLQADEVAAQSALLTLPHDAVVTWAGWSQSEQWILTTSEDGTGRIWDAESGELNSTIFHDAPVRGGQWSPIDTDFFLTWAEDNTVRVWSLGAEQARYEWVIEGSVVGARWNEDGTRIMTWGGDGDASIRSLSDGEILVTTRDSDVALRWANWSSDGKHILTFDEDGTGVVWDAGTGEEVTHYAFGRRALGAAWSRDESEVITWTLGDGVQFWRVPRLTPSFSLPHRTFVAGATFNADESRILSWSADDTVKVWEVETRQVVVTLEHIDWVEGAAFNTDESRILSWSYDSVFVWQSDGVKLAEFRHDLLVTGATWNEDETRVLSWSWDGTARVWDSTGLTPMDTPAPSQQEGQGPDDV